MKILQISSAQAFGGGERHLVDLANSLSARGHEVHAVLRFNSPLRGELKLASKNVKTLPLRNALDAQSANGLAKLVALNGIEIVHAHMARDYPLAAYAVRRNPGARLIVTRHVLFPLNRLHKVTLAHVSRVIAVSHAVARELQAQALVARNKITVIQNGVDVRKIEDARNRFDRSEFCRRWDLPAEGALVGSVGTLTLLKGHEDFLQAAAKVRDSNPSAFFIISAPESAATQEYRRRLKHLIQQLGLSSRVRLMGRMDDISELYCALEVFVSASHSESFGLAIVEAMAAGVATVATDTAGAQEIIEDGSSGVLIPIGAIPTMAEAIRQLLIDPQRRKKLAEEARRRVRERFSLERMVDETESVYAEVALPQKS
ncbi:MAG TPA: glycosyltransferase family 4 protein [Pyrinomonadaceae bacterium]|nr:glycosyltransferase family 4 protein [Pyrinomonadaceae bacterium]